MHVYNHVLITGATSGIGLALSDYILKHRLCTVISICGRQLDVLRSLEKEAAFRGIRVHSRAFDILDSENLKRFIDEADELEPLDLVIANAGVALVKDVYGIENEDEIVRGFDTNTKASILTMYYGLSHMLKRGHGHVAAVSSLASLVAMPGSAVYCASKAALSHYLTSIDRTFSADGIKTTLILPGFVKTHMTDSFEGSKPFMMSSEKAARRIFTALQKGKRLCAFPYFLYLGIRLVNLLPAALTRILFKPFRL